MKFLTWDHAKNAERRRARDIPFEDIAFHLERGDLLDVLDHGGPDGYAGQRVLVIRRYDDVFLVPFVEDEETVFLRTIIPSRRATVQYLGAEAGGRRP